MPYIITTRYSDCDFPQSCGECDISSHAVATADDARRAIVAAGESAGAWIGGDALHGPVDRREGTIGPLPDGTVIQVQRVDWFTLKCRSDVPVSLNGVSHDTILAAYNAR
jgi:hypothetical protein